MAYIGIPPFGQTVRSITSATATAGQTTFNIDGGYVVGYVDVFVNGVLLSRSDFTATDGLTVVLGTGAALNDEFQAIAYQMVSMVDTYRIGEVNALLDTKQNTVVVNGIVKGDGAGNLSAAAAGTDYLAPSAIGVTVQAYDSTILKSADIGSTVQGYDADLATLATNGFGTTANKIPQFDSSARLPIGANWTVAESAGVLYFAHGGVNKMKLDSSGNLTVVGNVTAYGTM